MRSILCLALLTISIAGCRSSRDSNNTPAPEPEAIITVEYKLADISPDAIWQILEARRVSNWTSRKNELTETIEAQYNRLSPMQAADIQDRLSRMPEVINVAVKIDETPASDQRRQDRR